MRRFKFRIWDVANKVMIPFEKAVWTGVHISTPDGREYDVPVFSAAFVDGKTKLIALQFTGLIDKNGKEIYEGDIIKFQQYFFKPAGGELYGEAMGEVVFSNENSGRQCAEFEIMIRRGTGVSTSFNYNKDFEVIGNMYEVS